MAQPFSRIIQFHGNYRPVLQGGVAASVPRPCLTSGRNIWLREDYAEAWNGMLTTAFNMTAGFMVPLANDAAPGGIGSGTVLVYRADSTAFIGSGNVYRLSTQSPAIATASTALQLLLNGSVITVGLTAPTNPVLYLAPLASGGNNRGNYSVKLTQTRSATGEESNASLVSNVVTADPGGQKLIVSLDGFATPTDGKSWILYGSDGGSSQLGPWWYRVAFNSSQLTTNVDKDGQSRPNSIIVTYENFDMQNTLAPFDFFPPTPGTHCTTLGSVMIVLGGYGKGGSPDGTGTPGAGVSPSKVGTLAFPPSYVRFLNPAAPIIRVDGRPGQGWQAVWTAHSLQSILLSGDDAGPVFIRSNWPNVGIQSPNGACMLENGEIYAFSSDGFPVRTSGTALPDASEDWRSWAEDVRNDLKVIDPAHVSLGHHQREDAIIFFDGVNATAQPFMRTKGGWHPKFDIPQGNVTACAEVLGKLYCLIGGIIYQFDAGNSPGTWKARQIDEDLGNLQRKTVFGWKGSSRGNITRKLYGNQNYTTALETETVSSIVGETDTHNSAIGTNVADLTSFTIESSGTNAGDRAYPVQIYGVVEEETFIA